MYNKRGELSIVRIGVIAGIIGIVVIAMSLLLPSKADAPQGAHGGH